jgi:P pilus assembly chaperone PapD
MSERRMSFRIFQLLIPEVVILMSKRAGFLQGRESPKSRNIIIGLLPALFLAAFVLLAAHQALALRVTMKRVIFEGPKRTEILTIINNSAEEQVYRLGWRRMSMTENSSLEFVEGDAPIAGLMPADEMIKYAPRRIVLAPGASQQVRLMLRRPKDLAPGEYRSHLWIQPEAESIKFTPNKNTPTDKPSIQIKMLTGLTLPVFVRSGNLTAKASITEASAAASGEGFKVKFVLNREGNRSLYGDLRVSCDGKLAREIRGIAVYTETVKRNINFDVPMPDSGCHQVNIKYVAPEEDVLFKGGVMAEANTSL